MVLERVKALVSEQFDVEEDDIGPDTSFRSLGADSFDIAELVAALREEFEIEIPDEVSDNIETVGDAVTAVEKNMEQ